MLLSSPFCYFSDGHLAVTDANLVLGRILPEWVCCIYYLYFVFFSVGEQNISKTLKVVSIFFRYFPNIFGPGQDEPLDKQGSYKAFQKLSDEVSSFVCVKSVQMRSYFWSVFSCIRTEYRKMQTRNNSVFELFSSSVNFQVLLFFIFSNCLTMKNLLILRKRFK